MTLRGRTTLRAATRAASSWPGRRLLAGAAAVYGAVTRVRNYLYDAGLLRAVRAPLPVVSVGNVTVGGSGKTPLVRALCGALVRDGYRPVVVSRGYKGRLAGPHEVDPARDTPEDVGDEPLMLAASGLRVVVARRRALGARFVAARSLGDVVVLDDGFQHRALARDVDVVSVDVSDRGAVGAVTSGLLLPAGRLREPAAAALRRAHAVVLTERGPPGTDASEAISSFVPAGVSVFRARLSGERLTDASGRTVTDVRGAVAGRRVVAFCGLAGPEPFFRTVDRLVGGGADHVRFGDHHAFTPADLAALAARAPGGAVLVCSRKDFVKLRPPPPGLLVCDADVTADEAFYRFVSERLVALRRGR